MGLNWKEQIEYFSPLEEEDLENFAAEAEVYRAASSYNRALDICLQGQWEESFKALEQISHDYPLFVQAGHLYALLLAVEGRELEAEERLKKLALLDSPKADKPLMQKHLQALIKRGDELRQVQGQKQKREALLTPVKRELAQRSILEKAQFQKRKRQEEPGPLRLPEEEAADRRQTAYVTMGGLVVGLVLFLLFFFLIRPGIKEQQATQRARKERLDFLEERLLDLAPHSDDIGQLLGVYQRWLERGRQPSTEESTNGDSDAIPINTEP